MKQYLFALLGTFVLFSCSKNNDGGSSTPTKGQLLTLANWTIESSAFRLGTTDYPLPITSCLSDNIFTFRSDNTGTMNEGTDICSGSQQSTNFTWSFANNETAMNISGVSIAGVSGQFKLVELSTTRLSLGRDTTISSVNGTFIVNFKH